MKRVYITIAVLALVGGAWGTIQLLEWLDDEPEVRVRKRADGDITGPAANTKTNPDRRSEAPRAARQSAPSAALTPRTDSRSEGNSSSRRRGSAVELDPQPAFIPGEVIVVEPPENFQAVVTRLGFVVLEATRLEAIDLTFLRLQIPSGRTETESLQLLDGRFPGLTADLNHNFIPSQDQRRTTSDRRRPQVRTARDAIDKVRNKRNVVESRAREAMGWNDLPASCGRGVTIGMIDSAVDLSHPALLDKDIVVRNVHSRRLRSAPPNHGTSIAALLVGRPDEKGWGGIVPGAALRVANIFAVNREGDVVGSSASILRGINWLATQEVQVVNIGLTGPNSKSVRKAMAQAQKKDLILIAAVGNRGLKRKRAYPAGFYHVIGVTAIGPYKGVMKNANLGDYVEFAAPGVRLWTAIPGGGRYQSGSSFASAYVTAIAATKIAAGLPRDTDVIRAELQKQVEDLGKPGRDDLYGWGLIKSRPRC